MQPLSVVTTFVRVFTFKDEYERPVPLRASLLLLLLFLASHRRFALGGSSWLTEGDLDRLTAGRVVIQVSKLSVFVPGERQEV